MKSILRALALTGVLGLGAAAAQAQVRVYAGFGPRPAIVAAVPPCPGVGYVWTAGYYDGPVWVTGRWMYRGYDRGDSVRSYAHRDYDHGYSRDRDFRRDDHPGNRAHR
jgi:hypothetical protein